MKTIELRHNPFKAETIITVDGREIHLNCIGTGEGSHVQEWKDSVFSQLIKKINIGPGSPCAVVFHGVEEDYIQLQQSWESYCNENKNIKIYFEYGTKPPVTLSSKEVEINDLFHSRLQESPCDSLKSADFSVKIESVKKTDFPAYLGKAEKLYRQTNEYVKFVESLYLRDEAEQHLVNKNSELAKLNADMEERRRLEAENAGIQFEEAAVKLENEVKKEVKRFFKDTLSETNTEIDTLQSGITEKINKDRSPKDSSMLAFAGIPYAVLGGTLVRIADTAIKAPDKNKIKKSLNKLINENLNKIIEVPLEIYKNVSSAFMSSIDKPVIESFDRKIIAEYRIENDEDAELTDIPGYDVVIGRVVAATAVTIGSSYASEDNEALKKELVSIFDNAKTYFTDVSEKIKVHYLSEFDKIIDVLKKKSNEEKEKQKKALELSQSANDETKDRLETEIKTIEKRLNWINDFEKKLNGIFDF
jgi:gas vesicle protein